MDVSSRVPICPTITSVPSTSEQRQIGREVVLGRHRVDDEVEAGAACFMALRRSRREVGRRRARARRLPCPGVRLMTVTWAPRPAASLTAMWPRPPRPITPTRLPGPTSHVRSGE